MSLNIPLGSEGSQKLTTVIDGTTYNLKVSYNSRMNVWTCDFSTSLDLIEGVGLLSGVDILGQFTLTTKNLYVVNTTDINLDASSDTLGSDVLLVKLTDTEVSEIESSI